MTFAGRGRAAERLLEWEPYKALKASGILDMSDARVATSPVKVLDRSEFKTLVTGLSDTQAGAFILADRQGELAGKSLRSGSPASGRLASPTAERPEMPSISWRRFSFASIWASASVEYAL